MFSADGESADTEWERKYSICMCVCVCVPFPDLLELPPPFLPDHTPPISLSEP